MDNMDIVFDIEGIKILKDPSLDLSDPDTSPVGVIEFYNGTRHTCFWTWIYSTKPATLAIADAYDHQIYLFNNNGNGLQPI